jgi:cation diffusion facilitator CzcD-associated flavoprotein CzcO
MQAKTDFDVGIIGGGPAGASMAGYLAKAAVEKNEFSKASFANFERTMRYGTTNGYEFISVHYRLNVLFTYFITGSKYRIDVLKLLQGDVYDEQEPEVLGKMRASSLRSNKTRGTCGTIC